MPIVEVEGQQFEFPDGTSDDVIGAAIRSHFATQAPVTGGFQNGTIDNGVTTDIPGDTGAGFAGAGIIEPAATIISGAVAEPIAGIAGIAQAINPFADPGAGARAVEATREALTIQPKTEAGRESLGTIAETIKPVADVLSAAETFLGDETLKSTGSPALAAAAKTIPTALLEVVGLAAGKGAIRGAQRTKNALKSREVKRAVVAATPEIDQLKDVARNVYKEIDDAGVTLQPKAFSGLVNRVNKAVREKGFDVDITPKTAKVLQRFQNELGNAQSLTDIDNLRKLAQNAAKSLEPADAALGSVIVDNIDSFLDIVGPTAFKTGKAKAANIVPKYKVARDLWGRARRSELINDAFSKARLQASGFENGIVVQFRSILNNKKKSRFFKPQEIKAMEKVVLGTTPSNIAKVIGRLGFSEGHATNILGSGLGIAGGAAVGGPVGAVAVPVIGQVSRKLAQKLTRNNAELADIIVRAGNNAEKITKSYLEKVPKSMRSSAELSELLARPDISVNNIIDSKNALVREAAELASGNRILEALTVAAPGAINAAQQEQQ